MAKQLFIQIPKPCHERWDEMTPTQQGAFCKSCRKNVIDFSNKTENEIYLLLSESKGDVCGRFTAFQIQQPVRKTEINNGFIGWRAWAASVIAFFSISKIAAAGDLEPKPKIVNQVKTAEKHDTLPIQKRLIDPVKLVAGGTLQAIDTLLAGKIYGKVVERDSKEPVAFATVKIEGTEIGTLTDENGFFSLKADGNKHAKNLLVSYVGYDEEVVSLRQFKSGSVISLNSHTMMGLVVVTVTQTVQESVNSFIVEDLIGNRVPPGTERNYGGKDPR
jgi:hypothetical protein